VKEIRELTHPDQWRHCPGRINPVEDVSRGLEMDELLKNNCWLKGPSFLRETEDKWPKNKCSTVSNKKSRAQHDSSRLHHQVLPLGAYLAQSGLAA